MGGLPIAVSGYRLDSPLTASSDPTQAYFYSCQWDLKQIHAEEAWAFGAHGAGMKIALLDTGVDPDQVDLAGKVDLAESTSMLTFEDENRPCGPDKNHDGLGDCIDGYSCMVNVCVENQSVGIGNTCSVNAHCVEGAKCTTSPFVCREECEHAYGNADCGADEACLAMVDAVLSWRRP